MSDQLQVCNFKKLSLDTYVICMSITHASMASFLTFPKVFKTYGKCTLQTLLLKRTFAKTFSKFHSKDF